MNNDTRQALDIDDVLTMLSKTTRSDLGKKAFLSLEPAQDIPSLIGRQNLLAAYLSFVESGGTFPWNDAVQPVYEDVYGARRTGLLLGDELLKARILLALATAVKECASTAREKFPALSWFSNKIRDFTEELERLSVLNNDGTLSDGASALLRSIRENLAQKKAEARRIGNSFLNSSGNNMLQERVLSMRQGRYAVLVKQAYVNKFPGIIVDKSASGNSVYMEPHSLVLPNNKIAALAEEQRQEERRIFQALTKMLLDRTSAIGEAENALAQLDMFFGLDDLMLHKQWHLPQIVKHSEFRLYSVRHPLIGENCVPVDAYCGKEFRALVITGPNTGGKTVVLKTCAISVYLAWCGLPIPAQDGSRVGNITAIYADIGDEQSIEQSLSTFSSHLKRIVNMLKNAGATSLVLLDELGAGTDPQEGAALGIAVLEEFLRRKTLVLATTHHNPIKRFATTTPGVEAACVDFDMKTLKPTYHLLVGIPGQSNAIAIARAYGMPEKIAKRAEECLNSDELNVERLIGQLQQKGIAAQKLSRELEAEKVAIAEQKKRLQSDMDTSRQKRDDIILKAQKDAQRVLNEAENKARALLNSLHGAAQAAGHREMAKRKGQIDSALERAEKRQSAIENRRAKETPKLSVGCNVKLKDSSVRGEVISLNNKEAIVQVGAMQVTVPISKLTLTTPPKEYRSAEEIAIVKRPEGVPSSIMVRGLSVDEALPMVERYLDSAMRAGYGEVTVIHGRGEGILRSQVHKLCERLPYVSDYRLGDRGEGGWGVTIVRFR